MGRLVEMFGVLGGSAGLLYAVGYFVLAGHSRVLGLPLEGTDTSRLLLNAWEFVVQGTLYSVLRGLQAVSSYLTLLVIGLLILCAAALTAWHQRSAMPRNAWQRATRRVERHKSPLLIVGSVVLVLVQGWQISAHVVPSASVTSLLAAPDPVYAPFPALRPSMRAFFEAHWEEVRRAIVGDGEQSDARTLIRLYVTHVAIATGTICGALLLWRVSRGVYRRRLVRPFIAVALLLGGFLCLYTPLYYGVTMKSYRYPRVRLTRSEATAGDPTSADFRNTTLNPEFLMQTTDSDYILYNARFREIHIVRRDLVGIVKVMADDFLFAKE